MFSFYLYPTNLHISFDTPFDPSLLKKVATIEPNPTCCSIRTNLRQIFQMQPLNHRIPQMELLVSSLSRCLCVSCLVVIYLFLSIFPYASFHQTLYFNILFAGCPGPTSISLMSLAFDNSKENKKQWNVSVHTFFLYISPKRLWTYFKGHVYPSIDLVCCGNIGKETHKLFDPDKLSVGNLLSVCRVNPQTQSSNLRAWVCFEYQTSYWFHWDRGIPWLLR